MQVLDLPIVAAFKMIMAGRSTNKWKNFFINYFPDSIWWHSPAMNLWSRSGDKLLKSKLINHWSNYRLTHVWRIRLLVTKQRILAPKFASMSKYKIVVPNFASGIERMRLDHMYEVGHNFQIFTSDLEGNQIQKWFQIQFSAPYLREGATKIFIWNFRIILTVSSVLQIPLYTLFTNSTELFRPVALAELAILTWQR